MKSVCAWIGGVVLFLYMLAWFDVVDFSLCIGIPGSCSGHAMPTRPMGVDA